MKESTKQGLGMAGVAVFASLAMQIPIVLAQSVPTESQNPGYSVEVGNEVFETQEPSPEPVVSTVPSPTVIIIPPRMQTPDPENPENGGNVGGSRSLPPNRGDEAACSRGDLVRCPSKAP